MIASEVPVDATQVTRGPTRRRVPSVVAVLAVLRPWYWPVSWGPGVLGYVLAAGSWGLAGGSVLRPAAAALVLGPLVWGAVLAMNDRYDVVTDRANPRKAAQSFPASEAGDRTQSSESGCSANELIPSTSGRMCEMNGDRAAAAALAIRISAAVSSTSGVKA